jgi:hypothetical protein
MYLWFGSSKSLFVAFNFFVAAYFDLFIIFHTMKEASKRRRRSHGTNGSGLASQQQRGAIYCCHSCNHVFFTQQALTSHLSQSKACQQSWNDPHNAGLSHQSAP